MLIPEDYAQVNHFFSGIAAPHGAQITYGVSLNVYSGTPNDAAEDLTGAFADNVFPVLTSSLVLEKTMVKFGPNDLGPSGEFALGNAGGAGSNSVAPNTSLLVSKNTSLGGRQGKGRLFLPGFPEDKVDGSGFIDDTYGDSVQGDLDAWYGDMIGVNLPMVLLRAEGSPVLGPALVTALTLSRIAATQRRRLRS